MQFQVVAHFALPAVFLAGDETEVLDGIAAADDELTGMSFGQLHTGHIECQVTLLAIFGFQGQRVFHRQIQTDERAEGLGERHIADVVHRARPRCIGGHITHETEHLVVVFGTHPCGVGTVRADGVLTGVRVRERDGLEMIAHPRQFA